MKALVELIQSNTIKEGSSGKIVSEIQSALRRAGHELVVDGKFGSTTRQAVEVFQSTKGIAPDGMVGAITAKWLDSIGSKDPPSIVLPSTLIVAPWLSHMRAMSGTHEIPGGRSNPLIISWARSLGARYPSIKPNISWYTNDDVPWCGLAVAEAVGECNPGYTPPLAPLSALNWASWGQKLPFGIPGAIGVKKRKGGGHVTIYESEYQGKVYCRGGNQKNSINVGTFNKADFIAWRWPPGAALPNPIKPLIRKHRVRELLQRLNHDVYY